MSSNEAVFSTVAKSLREFGYPDVTQQMIRECYEAEKNGETAHGVIGMFASKQFEEAREKGWNG